MRCEPATGRAGLPSAAAGSAHRDARGVFGQRYFLHLIGPPSLALFAASLAATSWPALRASLAPFCHQLASRSICIDGRPMGLCARCTGAYLGVAATWAGAGWLARRPRLLAGLEAPAYAAALVSVALWILGIEVDNPTRLAFGFGLGSAAALLLWRARGIQMRLKAHGP